MGAFVIEAVENGVSTYYLRSSVLGGRVVAEINWFSVAWGWNRGYVYAGSQLLAVQQGGVYWMHEDPETKSKRVTDGSGSVVSTIELDPWGADTSRSNNAAFQPKKFTSYARDGNVADEAMFRRYNRWHSRFDQPDPSDGSYDMSDPQSFNRYSYTQNDPVNFVDPKGLDFCYGETLLPSDVWPNLPGFEDWRCGTTKSGGGGGGAAGDHGGGGGGTAGKADPQNSNEQLSSCLRDALRQFFPQQTAKGNTFSPIDDARFKTGIPAWAKAGGQLPGMVVPGAITLGLYDIHYDPTSLHIIGGSSEDLKGVLEEVSHTVQFLQVWEGMTGTVGGKYNMHVPNYEDAQLQWKGHYAYYGAKGLGYSNDVEKWAKNNANSILEKLVTNPQLEKQGSLCGFDLTNYKIELIR